MTIEAVIARENAISVEVKLTGHAKRADGGLNLRFMVHPHDIPQQLLDAPIGTRYIVALVEIDDIEQPVPIITREVPKQTEHVHHEMAPAPRPGRVLNPDKRLVQRAGMLCNDPIFWQWINEQYGHSPTHEDAAAYVRTFCRVESRADIKPNTPAATRFDLLESAFVAWRDRDKYVESAK